MKQQVTEFQQDVIKRELDIFKELNLFDRLTKICSTPQGLRDFAEAFYFIRYKFYKLNFIIGTRSGPDEKFWGGLVENLLEELGGKKGVSHNELYRRFMKASGITSEEELTEPLFTVAFNNNWEEYAFKAPFEEALAAIAVYEILDNPDYQLMLDLARQAGVGPEGLEFFRVHAGAVHFEMFEEFATQMFETPQGRQIIITGADRVLEIQEKLWRDLLSHLERRKN